MVAEPPLGIRHHYARLGVPTFPDNEAGCQTLWPPASEGDKGCADCTVCVTPESHATGS